MAIHNGDQYAIPVTVTFGDDNTKITTDNVDEITIKIGKVPKSYPNGELLFDSEQEEWLYPITKDESDSLKSSSVNFQVRIKIGDNIIHSDVKFINAMYSIIKITE